MFKHKKNPWVLLLTLLIFVGCMSIFWYLMFNDVYCIDQVQIIIAVTNAIVIIICVLYWTNGQQYLGWLPWRWKGDEQHENIPRKGNKNG